MKKTKIQKNILKKIVSTLRKYNVTKAGIFGSYARGEAKKTSDIDILIKYPKGMGLEFVGVKLELEERLGKKVHLVTYKSIHPLLKDRILKEEVKII
jgi:hypothetical protein